MAGSGRGAFLQGRNCTEGPLAGPKLVGGPSSRAGRGRGFSGRDENVGKPSGMTVSGREALQQGFNRLISPPTLPQLLGRPCGRAEVVGGPSDRAGSGRGGLRQCRKRWGGPLAGPEEVEGPPAGP